MIVTVLMTIVFGALVLFGNRGASALGTGSVQSALDTQARRTVARMGDELLPSGFTVITPSLDPPGASSLTYRRSEGVVGGRIRWGEPLRLEFAYETGEIDDGLDNNGNGLIDEGVVRWTRDVGTPDEQSVILCHGVAELGEGELANGLDDDGDGMIDEPGLLFERQGDLVKVSLTLVRVDERQSRLTSTLETWMQPRN